MVLNVTGWRIDRIVSLRWLFVNDLEDFDLHSLFLDSNYSVLLPVQIFICLKLYPSWQRCLAAWKTMSYEITTAQRTAAQDSMNTSPFTHRDWQSSLICWLSNQNCHHIWSLRVLMWAAICLGHVNKNQQEKTTGYCPIGPCKHL